MNFLKTFNRFVLLIALVAIFYSWDKFTERQKAGESPPFFGYKQTTLKKLTIDQNDKQIELNRASQGLWTVGERSYKLVEQEKVLSLINAVFNLKPGKPLPIESSADNLSVYGLRDPALHIRCLFKDGHEVEIEFGSLNTYAKKRYLQVSANAEIYSVPEPAFMDQRFKESTFLTLTPLKVKKEQVAGLFITRKSDLAPLRFERAANGGWLLNAREADPLFVQDLILRLGQLRIQEYLTSYEDNWDFGFSQPSLNVVIQFKEKKSERLVLLLGKKVKLKGAWFYFGILGFAPNDVFVVQEERLKQLKLEPQIYLK